MSFITVHDQELFDARAASARAARRDTSRARWRLRADHADILEFGAPQSPELARVRQELDLLEIAADARP
ncbi:hypothetical protein [Nocardiopsis sp. ATB16-24]|uniref:hypothetical protein n=1 Tax=Nocardiopsis sp. ATB16-24 TaxID=3019555 RepID=UPI002555319C|nr:hypothetical protein [Nocardiopsis sp. ATB16-24]